LRDRDEFSTLDLFSRSIQLYSQSSAPHDVGFSHNPSRGHIMADELAKEQQSVAAKMQILPNGDSHLPKVDADPVDETGKKKKKKKKKGKAASVGNKDGGKCLVALPFTALSD